MWALWNSALTLQCAGGGEDFLRFLVTWHPSRHQEKISQQFVVKQPFQQKKVYDLSQKGMMEMVKKPTRVVTILLPMDVYEKIKAMADEAGWPLSRYLRQMIRRYLHRAEQSGEQGENWWKI